MSGLDEFQRTGVYGRDGGGSGLPGVWEKLLSLQPERESRRATPQAGLLLEELMKRIGVSHSTAHLRFGDDWRLEPRALDAGPGWEDRLAERVDGLVRENGRVRIYLAGEAASQHQRDQVDRAARREYHVLQGINHRGIVQAVQIQEHVSGPAILFRHRTSDLRLDAYLDAYGGRLTPEARLDLVRQLAEAVRYAHNRSLYHRALSARSVYVSAREDGSEPVLHIADWQTAARDFKTTMHHTLGDTPLNAELIVDVAQVYLAPETDQEFADPVDLDVFGLGSLAYLLLTGRPPADRRSMLVDRLREEGGLHPYAVADGVTTALDSLVFRATAADVQDRLTSAEEFLRLLDAAEADAAAPEPAAPAVPDPLTVQPGQPLDGTWTVARVLGTGATARALLVRRTEGEPGAEADSPRVFKVALDHEKDARLTAEAVALKEVGGGRIVKLLAEPRELGGRMILEIEYAGGFRPFDDREPVSLGSRLRGEGALGYDQLERFGNDLFEALDSLSARGVRHRDIKPDNLGLFKRSDGSWQLMLFDFSLADAPDQDLHAGTRGYLDPFLGGTRRERYDDHAEWYAAAVTLHEMASGERPVWGDGQGNPLTATDAELHVADELFDQALRDGLTAFFQRALHRDVEQRYDSLREMQEAWRRLFRKADQAPPATTPATVGMTVEDIEEARDQAAAAAEPSTPLDAAGLSPRAVSVAAALGASTVGALLDIAPHTISRARGAGNVIRKELNRRHRQWTHALRRRSAARPAAAVPADAPEDALESVETLAARLTPQEGKRRTKPRPDVVRAMLQLPGAERLELWPAQSAIARALGITQTTVSHHQQAAVELWSALGWLSRVRDEMVAILSEQGRIMTAEELAVDLRARHGAGDGDPADTLAQALAVVRAAAEVESRKREETTGPDAEPPARLAVLRRGGRVLLALEDQPGTDDPTPAELADYATLLGEAAVEVARRDPLPGRATVLRELREVPAPEGMTAIADTRLVDLAAAVAPGVSVSPRLELFPLDLDLVRAPRGRTRRRRHRRRGPDRPCPRPFPGSGRPGRLHVRGVGGGPRPDRLPAHLRPPAQAVHAAGPRNRRQPLRAVGVHAHQYRHPHRGRAERAGRGERSSPDHDGAVAGRAPARRVPGAHRQGVRTAGHRGAAGGALRRRAGLAGRPVPHGAAGACRGERRRVAGTAARGRRVRHLGHARRGPGLLRAGRDRAGRRAGGRPRGTVGSAHGALRPRGRAHRPLLGGWRPGTAGGAPGGRPPPGGRPARTVAAGAHGGSGGVTGAGRPDGGHRGPGERVGAGEGAVPERPEGGCRRSSGADDGAGVRHLADAAITRPYMPYLPDSFHRFTH
ncbi:BREX system serine/threonine kinase PglW [Streptomyces sp. MH13]|uniref:BREX system serine/threonine kinase PglW n=1 Tax=Streptomyces sp. MH13 TaxID=3417651 RepID=UPI003CE7E548